MALTGGNADSTPQPVEGTYEEDMKYWGLLSKPIRATLIEAMYEYSPRMTYDMYKMLTDPFGEYGFDPRSAVLEVIRQIEINDKTISKQEMDKKWIAQTPTTKNSSISLRRPATKRTAPSATRSGTTRSLRGPMRPKTSALPQGMAFDLFSTTLTPLSRRATKTGSNSKSPMGGSTAK